VEIDRLRSLLRAQKDLGFAGLQVALLFGSMARGRARPDSDVDLAVFGDVDPLALSGALSTMLCREVDVVRIEGAPIPLLDSTCATVRWPSSAHRARQRRSARGSSRVSK
jgi:predicted nucleotidyltransferase